MAEGVYAANHRALMREMRIGALLPALIAEARAAGVAFPASIANLLAEAAVDAEDGDG